MEASRFSEESAKNLLSQLEDILLRDPYIDEVGFIHPSQFFNLIEESPGSELTSFEAETKLSEESGVHHLEFVKNDFPQMQILAFWKGGHKLGISTDILLPLYVTAKHAFLASTQVYKSSLHVDTTSCQNERNDLQSSLLSSLSSTECDVLKHSKAVVLLSSDFGTAWNSRKLILSRAAKQNLSEFMDELMLCNLILSNSPKCSHAWSHRRWAIKMIFESSSKLEDILHNESIFVKNLAERSKMNYRAWSHCNQLISYMTCAQVLHEFWKSKDWAYMHIADNCIFHYRRRLLLRIMEDRNNLHDISGLKSSTVNISEVWEEEFDWNEMLIKRYIGREALWLHRRFLSQFWWKNIRTVLCENDCLKYDASTFINHEVQLVQSCSHILDDAFDDDFQSQAMYSATYLLWLAKGCGICIDFGLTDLEEQLIKACPEKDMMWHDLVDSIRPVIPQNDGFRLQRPIVRATK